MADHIPFVFGAEDCEILKRFYSDFTVVRISLQTEDKTLKNLPAKPQLWVDAGVDGLHGWKAQRITKRGEETKRYEAYDQYIKGFPGHDRIANPDFQKTPQNNVVKQFVDSILDACCALSPKPAWLSIPQLPMVSNPSRNTINRLLAQNTAEWKRSRKYNGKLILPVIFTDRKQVNLKTLGKGKLAEQCYERAGAQGVWVVESTLNDQDGSGSLDKRFQGLVEFHQELAESLPSEAIRVAGPYWGMNLVLWARGLIHHPAFGLGSAYQYHIPGFTPTTASTRLAISPLRRLALAGPELRNWLDKSLATMPKGDNAYSDLGALSRILAQGLASAKTQAKIQVAKFYRDWFDSLASVPLNGRALALFQQLSSAYVLGKSLPDLPRDEGTARRPERVAQQLMLNCL